MGIEEPPSREAPTPEASDRVSRSARSVAKPGGKVLANATIHRTPARCAFASIVQILLAFPLNLLWRGELW